MKDLIYCALVVTLLGAASCGGGGSSPTAPPPVTPPPPPPPTFSSLIGNWSGSLVIVVSANGQTASNTCTQSWIVTSQNQGQFTGTYTLSGGTTTSCAQAGTLSGTIGTDNRITGLNFGSTVGPLTGCTRIAGDGLFAGLFSNGGISATATETLSCTGNFIATRNLTLSMNR